MDQLAGITEEARKLAFDRFRLRRTTWLSCVSLVLFSSLCNAQQTPAELPIGFTAIPEDQGHKSDPADWVGTISFHGLNPRVERMAFRDSPLNDPHKGAQFAGWLRDGQHAIVLSVADKNHIDGYIVDRAGRIAVRLTEGMHTYTGAGGPSFYNAGVSPLYSGKRVDGYAFLASTNSSRICYVGPDGKGPGGKQPTCVSTGVHGCTLSPDGKYAACQDDAFNGIRLYKLSIRSGQPIFDLFVSVNRGDGETLPLRYAVWAPDSRGFVYQSLIAAHQGRMVYYELPSHDHPAESYTVLNTADWIAGAFCESDGPYYSRETRSSCKDIGTCSVRTAMGAFGGTDVCNIGTELPVWQDKPLCVYYSAFRRDGAKPFTRWLGRACLATPGYFEPLTDGAYHGGARSAAVSPDGGLVAFLSVTSATDTRSQIYVLNSKYPQNRVRKLTELPKPEALPKNAEAYTLHWKPY